MPRQVQPAPAPQRESRHVFAAAPSSSFSAAAAAAAASSSYYSFINEEHGAGALPRTWKKDPRARQYFDYERAVKEKEREDEQEALFREARVRMEGEMARQRERQAAAEAAKQQQQQAPHPFPHQHQHQHQQARPAAPRAGGLAAELGPGASRASLRKLLLERGWDESVLSFEQGQPLPNPAAGDPYVILGLSRDADGSEIRKRYRKLALLFHPDKNTRPGANECFCAFSHAYRLLAG